MPVATIVFYAPSKGSLGFKACLKHKLLIIIIKIDFLLIGIPIGTH